MGEGGGKVVGYLHVSLRVFHLNQQRNRVFKRVPACDCVVSLTYACSKRIDVFLLLNISADFTCGQRNQDFYWPPVQS